VKTSSQGLQLIREFEGLRLEAYRCPANVLTIGIGHTKTVYEGMKITIAQALRLLREDLIIPERFLNKSALRLNQNQFDALVSFIFNIGLAKFKESTLYRKALVCADDPSIHNEFLRWNKARVNGVLRELPGLTRRRQAEAKMYFNKS
jgi:lysozyme